MISLLEICFHDVIQALMYISVTGLNRMIKPDLLIWQDISSKPVFLRKEWFISRSRNLMMVLPR